MEAYQKAKLGPSPAGTGAPGLFAFPHPWYCGAGSTRSGGCFPTFFRERLKVRTLAAIIAPVCRRGPARPVALISMQEGRLFERDKQAGWTACHPAVRQRGDAGEA